MIVRIRGAFYRPLSAERLNVVARCGADGTISFEPALAQPAKIVDIRLSDRLGSVPRTLTLPGGEVFETSDHATLDRWLASVGIRGGFIHFLESHARAVAAALVLTAAFVTVTAVWGIPRAARHIAHALPAEVSAHIGEGALEWLDAEIFAPSALPDARQATLLAAFDTYRPDDDQAIDYQLAFRDGGFIGANAFALPDGTIVVTDQLVMVAESDDEVVAVILHEFGHVVHRHSLRQLASHAGLAMLSLLIVGDVGSASSLIVALPGILLESAYSRELETEADTYALLRMQQHGIDPVHFSRLFERLGRCFVTEADDADSTKRVQCVEDDAGSGQREESLFRYVSTHPSDRDRMTRFRRASLEFRRAREGQATP